MAERVAVYLRPLTDLNSQGIAPSRFGAYPPIHIPKDIRLSLNVIESSRTAQSTLSTLPRQPTHIYKGSTFAACRCQLAGLIL